MSFDHTHYIPCLRWKQGEYQAVFRLPRASKRMFTPLIEIPGIGYDFEKGTKVKTIDEHLAPFAKRVHEKWGRQRCFVDLNLIGSEERMVKGIHPVRFVFDRLRERMCSAICVTGLDRNNVYQQEVKNVVTKDKCGICLRIEIEQAAKGSFKNELDSLLLKLKVKPEDSDLIIDLGAPNFVPLEGFSKAIWAIVSSLPYLNEMRTFAIVGTSFPQSMAGIKRGVTTIPRHEWQLYKILVSDLRKARLRLPTFGDYAVSHPEVPELDWRFVKPKVKIRYTISGMWCVAKGKNYRDYGLAQYHELSKQILNSNHFHGSSFSWGDQYIEECANGGRTGNLPMWVQVDTNHHIVKVLEDIANFYAS